MEKIWLAQYPDGVPEQVDAERYSSLVDAYQQSCERFAQRPAFRNFGSTLSYQALYDLSSQFASYLQQDLVLQPGDRIAIMLPNVLQYPVAMFGALQAGLAVVNVNPLYTAPELRHQLQDAGVETIIVLENFAHLVAEVREIVGLKHIITTQIGDLFAFPKSLLINSAVKYIKRLVPTWDIPDAISLPTVLEQGKLQSFKKVDIKPDAIAFLQYTGGTTGVPKAAVLTHANMVANIQQVAVWAQAGLTLGEEVVVTALPLYHIFSLTANCLSFMLFGAMSLLITNPRDLNAMIAELDKQPFSIIMGVNTLFNALVHHPSFEKLDFSALKFTLGGGMAVQAAVAEKWQSITGMPLLEGYGLTEASPVITINPLNRNVYNGSIGLPVPSTEISLRDDNNQAVKQGEIGELCVKGPQVMREYWQQAEETAKVFTADGFLRTGDMARMDEHGYFYLAERKKDMILVSGFNVYPTEIEAVLATHPAVLEAAVIGVESDNSGEKVKAFVVKETDDLTEADLIAFCRQSLTAYKVPKQIEFRDSLPKSNVGKVLRRELR